MRSAPAEDGVGKIVHGVPRVTSAPALALDVRTGPFLALGCAGSEASLECGPLLAGACARGLRPLPGLAGLSPDVPIAQCLESDPGSDLVHLGGMSNLARNFVVIEGGKLVRVHAKADLVRRFAPVTTPVQALAFAIALTSGDPVFTPTAPPDLRYYAATLDGTRVIADGDGFRVNLFDHHFFGCGPHATYKLDVRVGRDGEVTVGESVPLYADPRTDGLCVD